MLVSCAVVAIAIGALVIVPNLVLTNLSGVSRSSRVAIATGWFVLAFVGVAWALRRLQAHHVV